MQDKVDEVSGHIIIIKNEKYHIFYSNAEMGEPFRRVEESDFSLLLLTLLLCYLGLPIDTSC